MGNAAQSPKPSFCDDGGRPQVDKYPAEAKFRPNDEVYILVPGPTREGPYTVASVENGQYKLCDANGATVKDGKTFEEKELEFHNPFG